MVIILVFEQTSIDHLAVLLKAWSALTLVNFIKPIVCRVIQPGLAVTTLRQHFFVVPVSLVMVVRDVVHRHPVDFGYYHGKPGGSRQKEPVLHEFAVFKSNVDLGNQTRAGLQF